MEKIVLWQAATIILGIVVIVQWIIIRRYRRFEKDVERERYINYSHYD